MKNLIKYNMREIDFNIKYINKIYYLETIYLKNLSRILILIVNLFHF